MRVLITCKAFFPLRGGTQNYVFNLVQRLRLKGYEVTVFTGSNGMEPPKRGVKFYDWEGIPIIQIRTFSVYGLIFPLTLRGLGILWRSLKIANIVHHNDIRFLSFTLSLLKNVLDYKLFLTSHGYIYHNNARSTLKNVYMFLFGFVSSSYNGIFNISKQDELISTKFSFKNTSFIREGVAYEKFLDIVEQPEKNNFLYFGRVSSNKGIHLLLNRLKDYDENYILHVIGKVDKDYYLDLKKLVLNNAQEDKVEWHGMIDEHSLFGYLNKAEFVMLPSTFEGFGITLIEALASGKKVLANKIPSYIEILNDLDLNDFLFDFSGGSDISIKINELRKLPNRSRSNLSKFNFDLMVDSIVNHYNES